MHVRIWQWPTRLQSRWIFLTISNNNFVEWFTKKNLTKADYCIITAPVPPAQLTNPGHAQFLPLKDNSNHSVDDAPSD